MFGLPNRPLGGQKENTSQNDQAVACPWPLLPLKGPAPPFTMRAFFRHYDGNSQIVSWPQVRSLIHSPCCLFSSKLKHVTHSHPLGFPKCFFGQCWRCLNLVRVLFCPNLSFNISFWFSVKQNRNQITSGTKSEHDFLFKLWFVSMKWSHADLSINGETV